LIYFTADLHFGHENIIRYCNRPFTSAYEMDAVLMSNWNAAINPGNEVYILGDLTMKSPAQAHEILSSLNGRKYFIRGLFHYPITEWDGFFRDAIHLYGHIHNSFASLARVDGAGFAFNVGVDCNDFQPVSIEKILKMFHAKKALL